MLYQRKDYVQHFKSVRPCSHSEMCLVEEMTLWCIKAVAAGK